MCGRDLAAREEGITGEKDTEMIAMNGGGERREGGRRLNRDKGEKEGKGKRGVFVQPSARWSFELIIFPQSTQTLPPATT